MKLPSVVLLLPLLALASCDSGTSSSTDTANVARAVAQLDGLAVELFARAGVPGMAMAVVHRGDIVYARGFGVRGLGDPAPVDADTVFQLASVSKSIGATVVADQVGKGRVDWDTPVQPLLPSFRLADPAATAEVTIGDLYAHRSGLPDHAGDDLEAIGHDREHVLERLHLVPSQPLRTQYNYTNFGLTAAAQAVAAAAGTEWEALSEQAIYQPLGMDATSSRFDDFMARANRAHPHVRIDGAWQIGPQRQPDAQSPAGGVSSSVRDLSRWMTLVLDNGQYQGRQLIPVQALQPALTPQIESSPATEDHPAGYYGYGFNVSDPGAAHKQLSHSGAFSLGAGTSFSLLPAARTGIVVLTNAQPVGLAEALCASYLDLVKHGRVTQDWFALYEPAMAALLAPSGALAGQAFPARPAPALPLRAYTGLYGNAYHGEARVEERQGQLALIVGLAELTFPLRHWDGDLFVFEPGGELATAGSRSMASFSAGPRGTMQSLKVELLDEDGLGVFVRR